MHKKIIDFQKGERIESFYFIKALHLKTSSNNNKYFDMRIADSSGDIDAKCWTLQEGDEDLYQVGDVVKIRADITLWMERLQVKIIKMRKATEDEFDFHEIVPCAPIDVDEMYEFVQHEIQSMKNDDIRKITKYLLDKKKDKFKYYPAAKSNHHSIRSGLLYHVYRMIKLGKSIVEIYKVNADLLISGIILHDLEKINEMNAKEIGVVDEYTTEGVMLGHIIQGIVELEKAGKILGTNPEVVLLLKHMILTHHYEAEYGSPKKPMFIEAELLHYIDMVDARVYDFEKASLGSEVGDFSEPIFSLDRRRIYKHGL